jgi:hypothetical protein
MRVVRAILFTPVFIVISPVLLLLGIIILVMDTQEGPLRLLFLDEVRAYGFGKGFGRFMQKVFVPTYKHSVQSFVLGAAGILVVTVGLRGVGVLPVEVIYAALGLEFTLLVLWAFTVYYTEESAITENGNTLVHIKAQPDRNEKLAGSIRELSASMLLLEQRLHRAETRFEHLGNLGGSLQALTARLNTLVGDQLSLYVRREFEQLLAELGKRVTDQHTDESKLNEVK